VIAQRIERAAVDQPAAGSDQTISFLKRAQQLVRLAELPGRRFDERYAPRFNPVGLIVAETGWSKLIATLLDPSGDHGQGPLFLNAFLREAGLDPARFQDNIRVATERWLSANRGRDSRIDILVTARSADGQPAVLGIEVKFDAADQDKQLSRYHAGLRDEFGVEPTLVYLARPNTEPSADSIADLPRNQFVVLPHVGQTDDGPSLARSFREALRDCHAERVRWFIELLVDALEQTSGKVALAQDPKTIMIESYIREHPEHLRTAIVVRDVLANVRINLLKGFAELLEIELLHGFKEIGDDWEAVNRTLIKAPDEAWASLRFRRRCWPERFVIAIERQGKADQIEYYGVRYARVELKDKIESPLIAEHLSKEMGRADNNPIWPRFSKLPEPLVNWGSDPGVVRVAEILNRTLPATTAEFRAIVDPIIKVARAFDNWVKISGQS
jgi:hypothetical protein